MAEVQQEPFVAPKSTEGFQNLFPPTGQDTGLSQKSSDEESTTSVLSSNAGIDYVIVFKFPTTIPKGDETITTRAQLETHVADSLSNITNRLTKVNLRFQVRPGKEEGTLLILVSSPVGPIKQEYRQER